MVECTKLFFIRVKARVKALATDNEDEVTPPSTPLLGHEIPMDTSEDSESEMELLRELDSVNLSWEESRETARAVTGKRVINWGNMRRIAKRTICEMRASPDRPSSEPEHFGYSNVRDVYLTNWRVL
jgi:hypothetical protein